jgi:hypothetical protein
MGHGADDNTIVDTDGDGMGDQLEIALHSDPNDADTDDDGVLDGQEPNPTCDDDHDGLIDVLDADSDNDGLFDGTEMGKDCSNPDTDASKKCCTPDADNGTTRTSPLLKDTDHGGVSDGSEDFNLNGKIDPGETDPTAGHGGDDSTVTDTDGDGLSDGLEGTLGSNPNDADTDDDGTPDGLEPNPSQDVDGDGKIDVLDVDSDGDGLFDGTEMGLPCVNPPTDPAKKSCIPDADNGNTTTSPLNPDTDYGGVKDGGEDTNKNGAVDPGEGDPNNPVDDKPCTKDSDCGGPMSGKICNPSTNGCEPGCRGTGNGCPDPQQCTSTDDTIGMCVDGCKTDSDCGGPTSGRVCDGATHMCGDGCRGTNGNGCPNPKKCSSTNDAIGKCGECNTNADCGDGKVCNMTAHTCSTPDGTVAEGNGIFCSARPANDNSSNVGWVLSGALGLLVAARRRRRR